MPPVVVVVVRGVLELTVGKEAGVVQMPKVCVVEAKGPYRHRLEDVDVDVEEEVVVVEGEGGIIQGKMNLILGNPIHSEEGIGIKQ